LQDHSSHYCIIGAGPVGLSMARALKKAGIAYEQLDADSDVGGNWRHGVYSTAHIISSKKTTEYADYPMPADYPDFPSAEQMLAYLHSYTNHFRLREHIQFKTKVSFCHPLGDHRWAVELATGETRIYRGVLVCNGHHWDCRWPQYPGEFTGEFIHSKHYKTPEQLRGKRVLTIGGGNSACDIASEAARVGKTSVLSIRRGYWFLPKTLVGKPLVEIIPGWCPLWLQRLALRAMLRVVVGRYEDYGLPRPSHRIFEAHPTVNSELLHYIKHGRVRPRPDIARFDGKMVEFADGTREEFDMVVAATGYHVSFPFLPEGLVPVRGGLALLYGGCVLPTVKNLFVIGTGQARYGFGPLLTPAAELIVRLIQLQEQMELPIGLVMKESGAPLPKTHLVDPHAALRHMRRARWTLPLLLRKEGKLRRRLALPVPPAFGPPSASSQAGAYD
jgi:cation diffusion facilitator CzcD-associated flavoprotein CzcO